MTTEELLKLRGKRLSQKEISIEDFSNLLNLCGYEESEREGAFETYSRGEYQFVL